MESLSKKVEEFVKNGNIDGLKDELDNLVEVLDFSKREVARTVNETESHNKLVDQCESNIRFVKNAINELVKTK